MSDTPAVAAAAQPAESTPTELTPQAAERAKIYAKHYESQSGQTPTDTPATSTTPAAPSTVGSPEFDYKSSFEATQAELAQIKNFLIAQAQAAQDANKPVPEPVKDWFSLLQGGNRESAEKVLVDKVATEAGEAIIQKAVAQAMAVSSLTNKVNDINSSFREQNPDMVPFEHWIALDAEGRFNALRGQITDPDSYVKTYTKAVSDSIAEVRKQFQLARAAGKEDAMTISREVVGAATLSPNAIVPPQDTSQAGSQAAAPDLDPAKYLESRRNAARVRQGLS